MLAYVFWHRPRVGVAAADYERRLVGFHSRLAAPSASFRISSLPFAEGAGYEDWYLVEAWADLGDLNARAVSGLRRDHHDTVAEVADEGWGGVYALLRGDRRPPLNTRWVSKPVGESYEVFLSTVQAPAVWQRQMVLGPAPDSALLRTARSRRTQAPRAEPWSISDLSRRGSLGEAHSPPPAFVAVRISRSLGEGLALRGKRASAVAPGAFGVIGAPTSPSSARSGFVPPGRKMLVDEWKQVSAQSRRRSHPS